MRQTKIIATIGPSSSSDATIEGLIAAGVDVMRLNFSHGDAESHRATIGRIRAASRAVGRAVAVLQDLSGSKIRTGPLEGGQPLVLREGDRLTVAIGAFLGRPGLVTTAYAPLAHSVKPGDRLLLDDGRIDLEVESVSSDRIGARVIDGGSLGEHKGISAPNVPLPALGVTDKDTADLRFGLAAGVDLVALSFVQSADDITRARTIASEEGRPRVPIVAKLERPEALTRLPDIAAAADALMVARGDLALALPLEEVPRVQKEVLHLGAQRGLPVIVATEVLESMRTEYRPTRAEVSDAAGAVDGGAAAIMLSGETAIGAFPVRSVQVLDRIIRHAEAGPRMRPPEGPTDSGLRPPGTAMEATARQADHLGPLCDAAVTLAARGGVDAIVALTREGRTARMLSARRPSAPVYAATDDEEVARRLCLWWGAVRRIP